MNYKSKLTAIDTPSRKARKSSRLEIFLHNKQAKKKEKKAARLARVTQ
jgi:hypothetical protein